MNFLLDTNVVSEWVKPQPDANVVAWLTTVDEDRVFISVASFAEIRYGVERLAAGRRRDALVDWLANDLPTRFEGRVLGIDRRVAESWGVLVAHAEKRGFAVSTMDAFFVATAVTYGLTLVTRNVRDFAPVGVPVLDPWNQQP